MDKDKYGELNSESVLRALRSTDICLFRYFPQDRRIVNTARTCRQFSCREEYDDAPDSFIQEFVYKEDRALVADLYRKIWEGQEKAAAEYRVRDVKGWCRVTMTVTVWDEEGKPLEAIGVVENLFAAKNRERELIDELIRMNREKNERLESILSGITGGFLSALDDEDYTIDYCSEDAAALLGYRVEEFIISCGGRLKGHIYPPDWPRVKAALDKAPDKAGGYRVDYRVRHRDGRLLWISESGKRVVREDGIARLYTLIQDVTEEKRKTEQLRASIQAFRMAADAVGDVFFIFNADRFTITVGDIAADRFGMLLEQSGVPYETVNSGMVTEDSKAEYIRLHEAMINGEKEAEGIVRLVTADGETGVYELKFKAMLDEDGESSRKAVGIYKDITRHYLEAQRQKRSFQELRKEYRRQENRTQTESRRQMEAIYALSMQFFSICHIHLGENTCMILRDEGNGMAQINMDEGYEEFFHAYCGRFVKSQDRAAMRKYADIAYLKKQFWQNEFLVAEYRHIRFGWCRARFVVESRDKEGDAANCLFAVQIIEEEKRRELDYQEALEQAYKAANRANQSKTTFLSNMSHDIRTPMNAVIGFASIAAANADNEDRVKDCMRKILTSGEHLQGLINEILDMSRIESGKVALDIGETSLSEILHNMMPIIQPQIQSKQLNFYVDTAGIRDEYVYADAMKTRQILINIIGNAIKFTHVGGSISLRIFQEASSREGWGAYRFVIKDTGIGMSEEFQERIFEPFEKECSTTVSGIDGTGLGMAIVKNLVDMMDGSIQVKSALGQGSEFTVRVSFRLQKEVPVDRNIHRLKGLRALVVDDDSRRCESIARMLNDAGMRPDWTVSAKDALLRAERARADGDGFSACIIDWLMPEMDGIELTRRIRSAVGDEIPIVILTAYDCQEIEEEAKAAGVTALCAKPLFMSDLAQALLRREEEGGGARTEPAEDVYSGELNGVRALLAEDNEINAEIAEVFLQGLGMQVEVVCNGREAVERLRRSDVGDYEMVLMDIQMPIMDGYEAARSIRRMERADMKKIPIIAMTANAFAEDVEAAKAAGMDGHIPKPLDRKKAIATMASIVNGSRAKEGEGK